MVVSYSRRCACCTADEDKITESVNVRKDNFTKSVNFLNLREKSGLTLSQLAALSGYSIATINGLELKDSGSQRLREKLQTILTENVNKCELPENGVKKSAIPHPVTSDRLELSLERIASALERIAAVAELQNPPPK